jgi:hypothetical protein
MVRLHYYIIALCIALIAFTIYYLSSSSSSVNLPTVPKQEIYCIGTNKYRYTAAQDICRKMGGRLATKEELHHAYKAGADWCTLGWVKGLHGYSISSGTSECLSGFRGGSMPGQLKLGAVCYGIKPRLADVKKIGLNILPWNQSSGKWSYYN